MLRHITMWNFSDDITPEQKKEYAKKIKADLEALNGKIEGMISLKFEIEPVLKSDRDVILDTLFTDAQALERYMTFPDHVKVSEMVKPIRKDRASIDFYVD